MIDHVYSKFPNHIETIQALLQKDANFREICADYAEVRTRLDDYRRSQGRPSAERDHARRLMRDLENEITESLSSKRFQIWWAGL